MRPFDYQRPDGLDHAALLERDGGALIAGGTNLLDLMKLQVETPETLVDINRIGLNELEPTDDGGMRIGALVSNSVCAADPRIRADWPVLSRAILSGASGQLRNKATTGGNLCQRTRCYYFMNIDMPCNKREPGTGCSALNGRNRIHAVLGANENCIATYPGDMAVAMYALDATVEIAGPDKASRSVKVRDFHRLPGDMPDKDNVLEPGEVITGVILPAPVGGTQLYRKVRERSSYAFALVSIAAVIRMEEGTIAHASLAFGSMAHKPWHDPRLDAALTGAKPGDALFDKVADLLLENAEGYGENDFKIPLARRTVKAVLREATGAST